jgi:alpha-mannosidase
LDTFGHHAQLPQLLKLGGYSSFWFFRGVPRRDFPSEFMWEGIDGTRILALWEPFGYGDFYGSPGKIEDFERFAKRRFNALDVNAKGHDRVVYAGADVSDPREELPLMMQEASKAGRLPFNIRFGVPTQFEEAVLKRTDLPNFKIDLNPIFQGTYSSRIELKQYMRMCERLLLNAEKLSAIGALIGTPSDRATIWQAWEPVLFNETHDLASGVMTDHVYDDTVAGYEFAKRSAEKMIDRSWETLAGAIDTRGEGTPVVVVNPLSWARSDLVEVEVGLTDGHAQGVKVLDAAGAQVPVQLVEAMRPRSGASLHEVKIAFVAKDIPAIGYTTYRIVPTSAELPVTKSESGASSLENDRYQLSIDPPTGAIKKIHVKDGDWEALSAPGNVVFRQDDHGDAWEPYHGLDGGSRIAMTAKQPMPKPGVDKFSTDYSAKPGTVISGPVYNEFTVAHPFDNGRFATTIRLVSGSSRIDIATKLVNETKFVRYQAIFPTTIKNGHNTQSIPFGALDRPEGIEFPAQDWVDCSDGSHGVALLNIGLPGNLASDGTMLISLLRAHTLGAYGYGGKSEPGMGSETGFELGQSRTLQYSVEPHRGDWREAQVWRDGMELNNPLICRKVSVHTGSLPLKWGLLEVSSPNVVVTSVAPGRDGGMLVRVYEAAGKSATNVTMTMASPIASATEVNLMEDKVVELRPEGKALRFDLSPFQITTLSLRFDRLKS